MFLHEENVWTLRVHGDVMDAVADLCRGIRNVLGVKALVDGFPGFAAVVGAKRACGGNSDVHALRIALIENDGVEAHAARTGLPLGAGTVAPKAGEFLPGL